MSGLQLFVRFKFICVVLSVICVCYHCCRYRVINNNIKVLLHFYQVLFLAYFELVYFANLKVSIISFLASYS